MIYFLFVTTIAVMFFSCSSKNYEAIYNKIID